jgi:hypothetical protein
MVGQTKDRPEPSDGCGEQRPGVNEEPEEE